MEKKCTKCNAVQRHNWKNKAKGLVQKHCYKCMSDYQKAYYTKTKPQYLKNVKARKTRVIAELRAKIDKFLTEHPCIDCGEKDLVVLDFDHITGEKKSGISEMVKDCLSWDRISAEIDKCAVRCANCHRRKTAKENNYYARASIG